MDPVQLLAGIGNAERPVDLGPRVVAPTFPGSNLGRQSFGGVEPSIQALPGQHTELHFGHVQPTAVLGRVVKLQALGDPPRFVQRLRIQLQHVFHAGDEVAAHLRDAPRLLLPRLERVFFSSRRTVDSEIDSTISISTARFASKRADHWAQPSGASEQARATIIACCLPSNLAGAPLRGFSVRALSSPSRATRWRSRSTVEGLAPVATTIWASVWPWSASTRICNLRRCRPFMVSRSTDNCARNSTPRGALQWQA